MKTMKICIALLLCLCLLGTALPFAFAATVYHINGKDIAYTDFQSARGECWTYAQKVYKKIWGVGFTSDFGTNDNELRRLPDTELTLTAAHLREYVSAAALGSVLRICTQEDLHKNTDYNGHSQIIVAKSASGFTVIQGGLTDAPYCNEQTFTWDGYVGKGWLGGKYKYIKYIKWPGAQPYRKSWAVTYKAPGATNVPGNQTKYQDETLILSELVPEKTEVKTGSYTLTLDPAGGSFAVTSLSVPWETRYPFESWNTKADGSGLRYDPGDTYTENAALTLNARWGVRTEVDPVTLPEGEPKRAGYFFLGWTPGDEAGTLYQPGRTLSPEGNLTLHARWRERPTPDCTLPAGLTALEPEALAGTAFRCVRLPETLTSLPARVFAGCERLEAVYIPVGVTEIDPDAFAETPEGLLLIVRPNSEAARFAEKHGLRVQLDED